MVGVGHSWLWRLLCMGHLLCAPMQQRRIYAAVLGNKDDDARAVVAEDEDDLEPEAEVFNQLTWPALQGEAERFVDACGGVVGLNDEEPDEAIPGIAQVVFDFARSMRDMLMQVWVLHAEQRCRLTDNQHGGTQSVEGDVLAFISWVLEAAVANADRLALGLLGTCEHGLAGQEEGSGAGVRAGDGRAGARQAWAGRDEGAGGGLLQATCPRRAIHARNGAIRLDLLPGSAELIQRHRQWAAPGFMSRKLVGPQPLTLLRAIGWRSASWKTCERRDDRILPHPLAGATPAGSAACIATASIASSLSAKP